MLLAYLNPVYIYIYYIYIYVYIYIYIHIYYITTEGFLEVAVENWPQSDF